MSLDQIKDSQRLIGVLGQNAEYYFWSLSLTENTTWYGNVIDLRGKKHVAILVLNQSTSPAALASAGVQAVSDASGSNAIGWLTGAPAAGGVVDLDKPSRSRYIRPVVKTGSTAGTYNVLFYLAIYPV